MKPQDIMPPVNDVIDTEGAGAVTGRRLTLEDLEIEVNSDVLDPGGTLERPRRDVGH
ncbi:hypothetical protein [Deinococcus soli (ex Cha et al. 2016)]|uniref:Uncharacterized protein n=2 Tax=Deinococcus soli (ex Cha et al. 2016) TaxID=1309411 RepID=A0ACC6KQ77_9DEIO|nr:hypothetical protein [Deinococcus soli (ex Cha et al. 2016)]MDR6221438.1 hypothetical protein [Deinococcus soli (ex Cha et al. 2016)]MDR6331433.1 hypothetical protein [Deinococcus soli (ex Cha et al. 2016)]MDR6754592.1 hypothetical protein [Deinococcus soli (ex Cha et al. 2016)]